MNHIYDNNRRREDNEPTLMQMLAKATIYYVVLIVVVYVLVSLFLSGKAQGGYRPSLAVIRVQSHGASAVCIASNKQESWLLSCAHMFAYPPDGRPGIMSLNPNLTRKPIVTHSVPQKYAINRRATATLVAVSARDDLSLIKINNGTYYYCSVAPVGFSYSTSVYSSGYDKMRWPVTVDKTFIVQDETRGFTYTRGRPVPGRSGGGLFDSRTGYVVGIVKGFELTNGRRGIYLSHDRIINFLIRVKPDLVPGYRRAQQRISTPQQQYYAQPKAYSPIARRAPLPTSPISTPQPPPPC